MWKTKAWIASTKVAASDIYVPVGGAVARRMAEKENQMATV
jgi:hypothetical protein